MAKFKLQPNPTFSAPVLIPVPGGEPADIVCTFRHRSNDELKEFLASKPDDPDFVMGMLTGWDLDDEFGKPNVEFLLSHHQGAATAISKVYFAELQKGRLGN
jgi:Phage tail assembly chaperone